MHRQPTNNKALSMLGVLALALTACGTPKTPQAQVSPDKTLTSLATPGIVSGNTYKLLNPGSKLALDVAGCGSANGTNVQMWADGVGVCNSGTGQQWTVTENADGSYKVVNVGNKLALDAAGCGLADGTNVQVWADGVGTCNSGAGQKWNITQNGDGTYRLVNPASNKSLDIYGNGQTNGTNVNLWTQNTSAAQKWQIVALGTKTAATSASVYFYTGSNNWSPVDIVYGINNVFSGAKMDEAACAQWVKKTVDLGTASSMSTAFNNSGGDSAVWDNNGGANYTIGAGISTVKDGVVTAGAASPCGTITNPPPVNPPPVNPGTSAPAHLGVIYSASQSTFSLWSPDSADVVLNLGGQSYPMAKVANANGYTDVYSVTVPGNQNLKTYNFRVNGQTTRDPYGVMVQPGTDNNVVLDLAQTALPGGWAPTPTLRNRVDSVIYETQVRDFTVDSSSGIPANLRGKYAGMTAAGTTVNGAGGTKTGIDHLVDLGVTHVQLMPVYDFASCSPAQVAANPNCYNWGYDPINYNVPEERFSQNPNDPLARVREFKAMVDAYHKRGIRVVIDVVYNHTQSKNDLGKITGKYYNPVDMSGTGNSLDGSQPMVARMIRDSLDYWVREYNIDGFRFDLLGVFDTQVVGEWGRYLNATYPSRNLLLYGEPWTGGVADPLERQHVRFGSIGTIADSHFGVFNGAYRDAIKNSKNDTGGNGGFIFNQDTPDGFGPFDPNSKWPGSNLGRGAMSLGVKGSPLLNPPGGVLSNVWDAAFTAAPEQTMNYADIHDNLNLADKVAAWASENGQSGNAAYLGRLQEYALSIVLTSQGIPVLNGGSEMQRSKNGDANSYESPDSVNSVKWGLLGTNPQIHAYVKALIAMRKTHPGFRFTTRSGVESNVQADQRSASLVYTLINSGANGDGWSKTLLIFNSGGDQNINLPAGNWTVAIEGSSAPAARVVSGSVVAAGTSITVLHQ